MFNNMPCSRLIPVLFVFIASCCYTKQCLSFSFLSVLIPLQRSLSPHQQIFNVLEEKHLSRLNFLKHTTTLNPPRYHDQNHYIQPTFQVKNSFLKASSSSSLNVSLTMDLEEETVTTITTFSNNININKMKKSIDGSIIITFEPYCHRPLGCTIEESLAAIRKTDRHGQVFVSKVITNSFANQAGLQVGDVIVDVTGIFGELKDVKDHGIDEVKRLASSRLDQEALQFRVMRGTDVINEHERALVEVITNPNYDIDEQMEEGIVNFIAGGYYTTSLSSNGRTIAIANGKQQRIVDYTTTDNSDDEELCDPDEGTDCLIDNMHNMWASMEDYTSVPNPNSTTTISETTTTETNKPWNSRSSPSGTFVQDPTTGKLRNMDDQQW